MITDYDEYLTLKAIVRNKINSGCEEWRELNNVRYDLETKISNIQNQKEEY